MITQNNFHCRNLIRFVALFFFLGFPFFSGFQQENVSAQVQDSDWSEPTNVSNSGLASSATMVVDKAGVTHIVWYDAFLGNRYSSSTDGIEWSEPVTLALPFGEYYPQLATGPENYIYAFWVSEENTLRMSRVPADLMQQANAWSPAQVIMLSVISYNYSIDSTGAFNLVYMTNTEEFNNPPGIYLVQGSADGSGWASTRLIYSSLYFRSLNTENSPNLSVATMPSDKIDGANTDEIFVAWDDPSFQRIVLSSSLDGGENWTPIQVIDQIGAFSGSTSPQGIEMAVWENQLMLVWQKSAPGTTCTVFYQTASPVNNEWSSVQPVVGGLGSCPTSSNLIRGMEDDLLWRATVDGQEYMTAWNGTQWSDFVPQIGLSSFRDPLTLRPLRAGCHKVAVQPDRLRIVAISCDLDGNKDIWFSIMDLRVMETWYPLASAWTKPAQVNVQSKNIHDLQLVAGANGNFYGFWMQPNNIPNTTNDPNYSASEINLSVKSSDGWSDPVQVIGVSEKAGGLSVAITQTNELIAVWQGEEQREIFISRALANRAFSSREWSEVIKIPVPDGVCSDPDIITAEEMDVYVVYAVKVNEARGIYVNYSSDNGRSWSEPVQVFDANSSGWEMVKEPKFVRTASGRLHVLWQHGAILKENQGYGLGYSFSDDQGMTWNSPYIEIEAPVVWADIVGMGGQKLLRVWQERKNGIPVLTTQISVDNGSTWRSVDPITFSGEVLGSPSLEADPSGNIHFLQIFRNPAEEVVLLHWIWGGENWTPGDNLKITQDNVQSVKGLSGSLPTGQDLAVIYVIEAVANGSELQQILYGVAGKFAEAEIGTAEETMESTPTVVPTVISEITVEVKPMAVTVTPDLSSGSPIQGDDQSRIIDGLVYGSAFSILLVCAVLFVRVFKTIRK